MLAIERDRKIMSLIQDKGSVKVTELSELCQVTEETIRRDLDRLEQQGKLKRSHGGAVAVTDQPLALEIPYFEREITNVSEKKRIAERACKEVTEHAFIILDASSTAWYMALALPNMPLTVLTNSIKVAMALSGKDKITVLSTGGTLSSRSLSFVGPLAERSLENYHVHKAFISCKGVHPERGLSESNELQAKLKGRMIQSADEVILLADSSKFDVQSFAVVADLKRMDFIISDWNLTDQQAGILRKKGLQIDLV